MSGDNDENPGLLTLEQVKGADAEPATAEVPSAEGESSADSPLNLSFIDDAESLLADIRSSVEEEVSAERERYEAERQEQTDARDREAREKEQAERDAIEAQLAVERARREAAADDRRAREEVFELEARRARGEVLDEPQEQQADQSPAALQETTPAVVAEPEQRRGTGFYLAIVGIPVLAIVGIGIVLLTSPGETLDSEITKAPAGPKVTVVAPPSAPPVVAPSAADATTAKAVDGGVSDSSALPDPEAEGVSTSKPNAKRKAGKKKRKRGAKRKGKKRKKRRKSVKKKQKKSKGNTLSFDDDDGF